MSKICVIAYNDITNLCCFSSEDVTDGGNDRYFVLDVASNDSKYPSLSIVNIRR